MQETINCPICGVVRKKLNQHLEVHNLTQEQFLELYPNHPLVSEREQARMSELWTKNNPMRDSVIASKHNKARRAVQERVFQEQPERLAAKKAKNSKASKLMWANRTKEEKEEIGEKIHISLINVNWKRANRSRLCYKFEYAGVVFDSGYAVQFAKFCDKYGIKWVFEQIKIRINDPTKRFSSFTPDFFLPDYGIYVEIKNNYALSIPAMQQKLHKAKVILPLLILSDFFLNYTRDNTEPSDKRNLIEGVENRVEDLRIFNTLVSKLHERVLNRNKHLGYLVLSYDRKICSELTGDSKKSEIKNFDDNNLMLI